MIQRITELTAHRPENGQALSMVLRSNRTVVNLRLELNQIRVAGAKAKTGI